MGTDFSTWSRENLVKFATEATAELLLAKARQDEVDRLRALLSRVALAVSRTPDAPEALRKLRGMLEEGGFIL